MSKNVLSYSFFMYFFQQIQIQFLRTCVSYISETGPAAIEGPESVREQDKPLDIDGAMKLWTQADEVAKWLTEGATEIHTQTVQIEDAIHKGGWEEVRTEVANLGLEWDTWRAAERATEAIIARESGEIGTDVTPEERDASAAKLEAEREATLALAAKNPEQREALERRASFLGSLASILRGIPEWADGVLGVAAKYEGYNENDGSADKFVRGGNSRDTPWCAGYVSTVLEEAGYNIEYTLSSKSFINEDGKGHVGFYIDGKCLGGNQSNEVNIKNITKPIKWWIMPEELEAWKPPRKGGTPENGAIIVFDRNETRDTNEG